jgi:transcriptional regulator with XRE-family HTH domain
MASSPVAIKAVREALEQRGWTQNELARQLGTNSAVVSRWLSEGPRNPGLEMALKIEALLGVPAGLWVESTEQQATGTDDPER